MTLPGLVTKIFVVGAFVLLGLAGWGAPAGLPSAQASTEISGQVVGPVDPFLLLRNVARYDPELFTALFDQVVDEVLTDTQRTALEIALALLGVSPDDPEALIDLLESLPASLGVRAALVDFLIIERETLLSLLGDAPTEFKNLLANLLPDTLDLNYLPLAGARLLALDARGAPVRLALSGLDGSYRMVLPPAAAKLQVTRNGYRTLVVDVSNPPSLAVNTADAQAFPNMIMMTPNPGRLSAWVADGQRGLPVRNALVTVTTATGRPTLPTNWLGTTSIAGVEPLLPGVIGGIGFHQVLIDAEDYYLEQARVLFLGSNASLRVNLTNAPPFGTLLGRVTVRRSALGVGYTSGLGNVEVAVLDPNGVPVVDPVLTSSSGDYRYETDTVPKGTWQVQFENPQGTGSITNTDVRIRAARETALDACFSSLNGSYGSLFGTNTTRSVRVVADGGGVVGSATSSGSTRLFLYEILGIPPGTYTVEFRAPAANASSSITVRNVSIDDCSARTLSR